MRLERWRHSSIQWQLHNHWALITPLTPSLTMRGVRSALFHKQLQHDYLPEAIGTYVKRCMSTDHANSVSPPQKTDPVFLHVKAGMAVIIKNTDETWRMADVVNVIGSTKNHKIPKFSSLHMWIIT